MASSSSPLYVKAPSHSRSISLPSRPHPLIPEINEQLSRLSSSQAASTPSSSSLSKKLNGLKDLYDTVDELLVLQISQKLVSQDCNARWADSLLDGSLILLDVCGTAQDVLSQTKDCVQEIQSVLRRKYSGELVISKEIVNEYLNMRKKMKKTIKKCLKDLQATTSCHDEEEFGSTILQQVEAVTADTFSSLLSLVAGGSKMQSKSKWSVVSKLMNKGIASDNEKKSANEFEDVDASLDALVRNKKKNCINMMDAENLRNEMAKLESCVQDLDEELECLFRRLVKTRSTFLNILSN